MHFRERLARAAPRAEEASSPCGATTVSGRPAQTRRLSITSRMRYQGPEQRSRRLPSREAGSNTITGDLDVLTPPYTSKPNIPDVYMRLASTDHVVIDRDASRAHFPS